ncbi:MAG: alpha-galactosidase [Lachnospiraceae bacterium]|nr:alpha-galactosidase [Lachnospiraceae bacterium]
MRITFIGAGSVTFTRDLVRDLMTFPSFQDAEIALMDIDEEKLFYAEEAVKKIISAGRHGASVVTTTDLETALEGASGVLSAINVGDISVWGKDVEIPKKYGINMCVGDTRGISGIFRFMRTLPEMMKICRAMEKCCPDAVFLNYTNPMAMLCRAMQSETKIKVTGLCHSVQRTAEMLAEWIGADAEDITYTCAGINHQAFYLDYKWKGQDAYPLIKKAVEEHYQEEIVRNEMFRHLGYYVTESSGHASEYVPWFRKRQDLLEKYCMHGTGWNPGHYFMARDIVQAREGTWKQEFLNWADDPGNLDRGNEYAAHIFNAVFGDGTLYEFNGNVRNFGLIDNLPEGCCVEVPVLASPKGFEPIHVGKLPKQLALLTNISAGIEELAVEGALTGNPEKIYQACYFDPLSSAVLSLEEIRQLVTEMFEANREYLPQFSPGRQ